jgi:hypothetical protein
VPLQFDFVVFVLLFGHRNQVRASGAPNSRLSTLVAGGGSSFTE